jgi:threonine synthase
LLVEPASAAGVGLLLARARLGNVRRDQPIVCVLTGHGLKDPEALTRGLTMPAAVAPTLTALRRAIG